MDKINSSSARSHPSSGSCPGAQVDREIMYRFDYMVGLSEDHKHSGGPTMSHLPCLDDQHFTMLELGNVTQDDFDL
ncbi:hypothetical protein BGZ88_010633 [Linnemannia elongata]|nr:hypothetical protein BGZ88_010633 [Linnemannia elongata]